MLIPLRDENPRVIIPKVTYAIVALNVAVFLLQMGMGTDPKSDMEFTLSYGLIPAAATGATSEEIVGAWEVHLSDRAKQRIELNANVHSPFITIITSMFMHGGFMHILWNMVFIWIFADNVEGLFGHTRFIIFYIICGIGA
ncbi:MAG TPA: rhomboid family intramembrane serine protease, partial [Candidatus Marinimicrobia bacterium]|nr:rhomboid family intramembrane serine protease [Candidatus Neomarinimicrobiota bacterium]